MKTCTITIPATSANLGPGFDCMGLALNLYNTFRITTASHFSVKVEGFTARDIQNPEDNLVIRTYMQICRQHNWKPIPFALECNNSIPVSSGLGSSSTAILAGITTANCIHTNSFDKQRILQQAYSFEQHLDNIGAALFGGFVIGVTDPSPYVWHNRVNKNICCWVVTPKTTVNTEKSRQKIPEQVPMKSAIFNISHAALVATAFVQGNWQQLNKYMRDQLHEQLRSSSCYNLLDLREQLYDAGCWGMCLSGSGPSVLILCQQPNKTMRQIVDNHLDKQHIDCHHWELSVNQQGLTCNYE